MRLQTLMNSEGLDWRVSGSAPSLTKTAISGKEVAMTDAFLALALIAFILVTILATLVNIRTDLKNIADAIRESSHD